MYGATCVFSLGCLACPQTTSGTSRSNITSIAQGEVRRWGHTKPMGTGIPYKEHPQGSATRWAKLVFTEIILLIGAHLWLWALTIVLTHLFAGYGDYRSGNCSTNVVNCDENARCEETDDHQSYTCKCVGSLNGGCHWRRLQRRNWLYTP